MRWMIKHTLTYQHSYWCDGYWSSNLEKGKLFKSEKSAYNEATACAIRDYQIIPVQEAILQEIMES